MILSWRRIYLKQKINPKLAQYYRSCGLWTDKTLLDYWNSAVHDHPDSEYIVDDLGSRLTYAEVDARAGRLAGWMQSRGISAGDVVSLQVTPRAEFVIIVYACIECGAVIAPLGMRAGTQEWISMIRLLDSKMHFVLREYHGDDLGCHVLERLPCLDHPPQVVIVGQNGGTSEAVLFGQIMQEEPLPCLPPEEVGADDTALILFTSGTTRGSRGVMLTHNNIISSELAFNSALGLTESDSMFLPAPLSHATGFHHGIISVMLYGGKLILQERFDSLSAIDIMTTEKCTYSMGATPFVYDFVKALDSGAAKPPFLKYYICGGAPVPNYLLEHAWNAHKIVVCECYGSTESVPHVLVPPEHALEWKGKWSGAALDGIEIRVVDEQHRTVGPGTVGEEASRGPNVFVGYLGDQQSTDEVLDDEGWYYSGDLCYGDGAGRIKICGRKKDIIVRGGENLNINQINDNLEGLPGILDHAVIGMPDPRLGERICAFLVPEPGVTEITREQVADYLKQHEISKWLWPERIELIDAIPYTESGKVKKYLLSKELANRMGVQNEHR